MNHQRLTESKNKRIYDYPLPTVIYCIWNICRKNITCNSLCYVMLCYVIFCFM